MMTTKLSFLISTVIQSINLVQWWSLLCYPIFFAFAFKAKSFAIAILLLFFYSFSFSFLMGCQKFFRQRFMINNQECMWRRSGSFLGHTKKYSHKIPHVPHIAICDTCSTWHCLFTITSIHRIQKSTRNNQKHETWKQVSCSNEKIDGCSMRSNIKLLLKNMCHQRMHLHSADSWSWLSTLAIYHRQQTN